MDNEFITGFEKTAFIFKGLKMLGSKLFSKGGKVIAGKAKKVGANFSKNPMATAGKIGMGGLTGAMVLSEVGSVAGKAKQSMNKVKGVGMTSPSFSSYKR